MPILDTPVINPETLESLPIRDWLKKVAVNPLTVKSRLKKAIAQHGNDYIPQYDDLFKPVHRPVQNPHTVRKRKTIEREYRVDTINGLNIFDVLVPHAPTMQQFEAHRTHFGLSSAETLLQFMKWGAEASRYQIVLDEQNREAELLQALASIKGSVILKDPTASQSDDSDEDDDFFSQYEKPPVIPPLAPNALPADDWQDLINKELG